MNPTLASMISSYPSFWEMAKFSLAGFGVVLFVLIVLSLIMSISGKFFIFFEGAAAKKAVAPAVSVAAPKAAASAPSSDVSDPKIIAVIAAAVSVALDGASHRIVSLKMAPSSLAWSREGRLAHYASKNYKPVRK